MDNKWVHDKFNRHLTDEEVDLLIKVRDLMASDEPPSEYICWNLLFAQTGHRLYSDIMEAYGMRDLGLDGAMRAVKGPALSLYDSISTALEDHGTMENYLANEVARAEFNSGVYRGIDARAVANAACDTARLCWLDRMIATRAI